MFQYLFTPEAFIPAGVGFALFGPAHLAWLVALAVLCVGMVYTYRRLHTVGRRRMRMGFALGILCAELLRDIYLVCCGAWMWLYLPLHMCAFTMFLMVLWCFRPVHWCGQVLYSLGILGAVCALLFCNWTNLPLLQFQTIYSFLFHGILIGWIAMLLATGEIRPTGRGLWESVAFLCVVVPLTAVVNLFLPGCNFFFTNSGSPGSPLAVLIALFGRPWWLFAYAALAFLVLLAEFAPWIWVEHHRAGRRVRHYALSRK